MEFRRENLRYQGYGELTKVGSEVMTNVLQIEHAFTEKVYFTYYAGDEPYTRIVEYKKFTQHQSPSTLLGIEIPSHKNKLYPMPIKRESARAYRYFDDQIGRASCRERVCQYVEISVVAVQLKKN